MNLPSKRISVFTLRLGFLIIVLLFYQFTNKANHNLTPSVLTSQKRMKYILQWTDPNAEVMQSWGQGQQEFIKRKCKINNCIVTSFRALLPSITQFDAVAFHGPELSRYKLASPTIRSPHQKYVFVSMESSHNYPICDEKYDEYFNWTWTYRLDSDAFYGYITIRNITGDIIGPKQIMHWIKVDSMEPIDKETKGRLEKKNKAAAWFVSNCHTLSKRVLSKRDLSKREVYVAKLQQELNKYGLGIDIFGECVWATKQCPKANSIECLKMVQEEYYFYLAFENSFSEDYVTEKLLTALENYAVPVVYGGANYTRFMPDGIYLHGGELPPSKLAKEMNDIISDKDRYYSFFKWRNHYSYHDTSKEEAPNSDVLCRMCEMLHDPTIVKKETVYNDFRKWWNVPGPCSSMGSIYENWLYYFCIP